MAAANPADIELPQIPADAPLPWRDLWDSASRLHPDAPDALRHAIAAGVDPRNLRTVQLTGDEAPAFWFGSRGGTCAVFNRAGAAGTAVMG